MPTITTDNEGYLWIGSVKVLGTTSTVDASNLAETVIELVAKHLRETAFADEFISLLTSDRPDPKQNATPAEALQELMCVLETVRAQQ